MSKFLKCTTLDGGHVYINPNMVGALQASGNTVEVWLANSKISICEPLEYFLYGGDATVAPKPVSNKPLGAGQYFTISNNGVEMKEDEWLLRCFRERRQSKRLSLMGCDTLDGLLSLYPTHLEQFNRWLRYPIADRMAAYVFTSLESSTDDPLKYAFSAIERGLKEDWTNYKSYHDAASACVLNHDYTVVL
jgi:hypothetical protein